MERVFCRIIGLAKGRKFNVNEFRMKARVIAQLENILSKHKSIDRIIFCGGQMFLGYFANSLMAIVGFAEKHDIKVSWNAVGASKLNKHDRRTFQKVLEAKCNVALTYRDSKDFFERYVKFPYASTPDTALLAAEVYNVHKQKSDVIGIGILSYHCAEKRAGSQYKPVDKYRTFREIIELVEAKGYKWQFFTNGSQEDHNEAKEILQTLGYEISEATLTARPVSDIELVATIQKYCAIISYRLHSHIIAYSLGIPSFGFAWDKKVVDFFSLIDEADNCSPFGNYSAEYVRPFLENIHFNSHRHDMLMTLVKQNIQKFTMHDIDVPHSNLISSQVCSVEH
jgi:polysaccharide pyruvyl transferase WcaK-like protein